MKKLSTFDTKININEEMNAISECVREYWEIDDDGLLQTIIKQSYDKANEVCQRMVYEYVGNIINDMYKTRTTNISNRLVVDNTDIGGYKGVGYLVVDHDKIAEILYSAWFASRDYNEVVEKESGMYSEDFIESMTIGHHFTPKGYEQFTMDYDDYQGMEEINTKTVEEKFNGHSTKCGSVCSFPFPIRI